MKHILLFGAGKSATVLINYLIALTKEKNWQLTIADGNADLLQKKIGTHLHVKPVELNIEETESRNQLIEAADIVISMMPPQLHYLIAIDCIKFKKNLLTASYVDEKIKQFEQQIKDNNLLFLCEMGLDPGIDHMSAMQIINTIKNKGGKIYSFKSHCGGLVAPESDNNPWHYKISWNPKNIILAGKAGAIYKENGNTTNVVYENLFNNNNSIQTETGTKYAYYANRDSLSYLALYNLESTETFIRTTLRHPDFCLGWKNIVELKLTNEEKKYDTSAMTTGDFFKIHLSENGFTDKIEQLKTLNTYEATTFLNQLNFIGLNDTSTIINKGICSAADILQFILEQKLILNSNDKDLVVMIHEIEYELYSKKYLHTSLLEIKGDNNELTAMAKTVGLPLGIAAKLILENKILLTGLHIPTRAEIYTPVLEELLANGISFANTETEIA